MKRLALAAASVLLMLGTAAQAQTRAPLYGELGYSFLEFKADDFKVKPHMLRGIIGYEFHPNLAVEGMLGFGTRGDDKNVTFDRADFGLGTGLATGNLDVKVRNMLGVFVKPKYDFGSGDVFLRAGWVRTDLRVTGCALGVCASADDDDNDFAFGLGANYRFNPRMSVGLDWMRYYDNDGAKIQGVTVNFGYRF